MTRFCFNKTNKPYGLLVVEFVIEFAILLAALPIVLAALLIVLAALPIELFDIVLLLDIALLFDIVEPLDIELLFEVVVLLLDIVLLFDIVFDIEFDIVVLVLLTELVLLLAAGSQAIPIAPRAKTPDKTKVFFILIKFSCLLQRLTITYQTVDITVLLQKIYFWGIWTI